MKLRRELACVLLVLVSIGSSASASIIENADPITVQSSAPETGDCLVTIVIQNGDPVAFSRFCFVEPDAPASIIENADPIRPARIVDMNDPNNGTVVMDTSHRTDAARD